MTATLEENALAILGPDFPEDLVVIYTPSYDKHVCYAVNGIHGLAVFSKEYYANKFLEFILFDLPDLQFQPITFTEARELAKSKPPPNVAMHLLDDLNNPITHYVT